MKDNWENLTIDDIVEDVSDGGTPPRIDKENFGGSVPWVVIDDIKPEIYTTKEYLSEKGLKNCSSKLWPINTLILSTGATIGEVGLAKVPLTTKQGIAGIRIKEVVDIHYAYYIFLSLKNEFQRLSQGSTIQEIRPKYLKQIGVKITNNKFQQLKIAKILSTCDAVIEKTKAAIAKYQNIKQGMMHDLFTRGIDLATGKLRPTPEQAPDLYKDSELGKIPKDWGTSTIDDIAFLRHGFQFRDFDFIDDEGIEIVKIGQVGKNGRLNLEKASKISFDRFDEFKQIHLFNGDVLMALTGATLGKTAMVKGISQPLLQNYRVGHFSPKDDKELNNLFLYYLLIGNHVQNEILGFVNEGAQGNIGKADFEKIKISYPHNISEQEAISKKLFILDDKIDSEIAFRNKHMKIKSGLMQDLLTGKIEAKEEQEKTA